MKSKIVLMTKDVTRVDFLSLLHRRRHRWQLLRAGQAPVVVYFAVKWLPQAPGQALRVLALQAVAVLAACAPVYFFKL